MAAGFALVLLGVSDLLLDALASGGALADCDDRGAGFGGAIFFAIAFLAGWALAVADDRMGVGFLAAVFFRGALGGAFFAGVTDFFLASVLVVAFDDGKALTALFTAFLADFALLAGFDGLATDFFLGAGMAADAFGRIGLSGLNLPAVFFILI